MTTEERRVQLSSIMASVDQSTMQLIDPLLDEVVFMEERLLNLRQLPLISVHPKKPALQRYTPAAKQYKETMQSYMNAIRILCGVFILHSYGTG